MIPVGKEYSYNDKIVVITGSNQHPIIDRIVKVNGENEAVIGFCLQEVIDNAGQHDSLDYLGEIAGKRILEQHTSADFKTYGTLKKERERYNREGASYFNEDGKRGESPQDYIGFVKNAEQRMADKANGLLAHNRYAQIFPDDVKALQEMAQIVRQGFENAKANEREFGGRESEERFSKEKIDSDGLTGQERARFYDAIDNNRKGLMVGSNAVLLIDDSPNDSYISDYTLICWYGDKISPSIKAVYKISGFDYNIYNPKMNLINSLVEMEAKGVNVDFIRKALRDSLLDSKAVFKRYNRKTNRYNTLTKTNRANNQYPSQNNQAQTNGTGVSGQAKGGVSGVQGSKQLNDKKPTDSGNLSDKAGSLKSKDDTIYLSAVERGDMETAQRMVDEAPEVFSEEAKKKKDTQLSVLRWLG